MSVPVLQSSLRFRIRFSEIDAMRVVWHGAYAKYFEDAREIFGQEYDLGYLLMEENGYYAPLVDLTFHYRQPLKYGMEPEIVITYRPTEAAKIVFDYEIRGTHGEGVFATGRSVQVFMDDKYQLVWENPEFYEAWKKRWGII